MTSTRNHLTTPAVTLRAITRIGLLTAGLVITTAVLAADTPVRDPDLEAAMRHFGTAARSAAPAPPASGMPAAKAAPTARTPAERLQPELAEQLRGEPVLDAAARAALAREELRQLEEAIGGRFTDYDPNGLPDRLRLSENAVDALLRRKPSAAEPDRHLPAPTQPMPPPAPLCDREC